MFTKELAYGMLYFFTGKVHGSLARAGKVKGQTAKVHNRLIPYFNNSDAHILQTMKLV